MTILYQTQATAIGGRTGSAASADGVLRLDFDIPTQLGGVGGPGTNPEQVFAAGYAASFLTSLREVGRDSIAADANVTATVGVGPCGEGEGMSLDVSLDLDLPGISEAEARVMADRAHALCPYSKAMHGNVKVRVSIL